MNEERWLPVPGYVGEYEVSDRGRVRSLPRTITYVSPRSGNPVSRPAGGVVLKASSHCKSGHQMVALRSQKLFYVHHLVLAAFVGPKPEGMEALHRDGNPANNDLSNLRWGTRGENILDAVRHGTHQMARRSHCPRRHLLVQPNLVPSKLPTRQCLACDRARRSMRGHGHSEDWFRADADRRYREIMAGSTCSA